MDSHNQATLTAAELEAAAHVPDAHQRVASYFLGNRAENYAVLRDLFLMILNAQADTRMSYFPGDKTSFVTPTIQRSDAFKKGIQDLQNMTMNLIDVLKNFSVPFFSPRYAGHMCFETSMAGIAGWVATILFNPNNVAFEASPITTLLELLVGRQLCTMLGYTCISDSDEGAWGHIACDGTVANLESIWAARNLKFYPLALKEAMADDGPLNFVSEQFMIHPCYTTTELKLFNSLTTWELLNLRVNEILDIPAQLHKQCGITSTFLENAIAPFILQSIGRDVLEKKYNITQPIQYLITSTKHYSWPKGGAISGIGSKNIVEVEVDNNAQVDMKALERELRDRLKKQQAVYAIVAVIGSTEEGAVDPLDEMVALRSALQEEGMSFVIHADAAWGGYFTSMIPKPPTDTGEDWHKHTDEDKDIVPDIPLRNDTVRRLKALKDADSITIDPHKSGYIPYPAGALCYRDGRMKNLLIWSAPYIAQGETASIGIYGVEGSKPGAPAAAVFLHHEVIGLDEKGHGMLLGEVCFTSSRMSALWAALSTDDDPFIIVPFNALPNESDPEQLEKDKEFIRKSILPKSNEEILRDDDKEKIMDMLRALGSDLNINAFACNFKIDGKPNEDVEEANYLNNRIYQRLSITKPDVYAQDIELFLSATTLKMTDYGKCCTNFKKRLGLETTTPQDLFVLRNVVMSPFQTAGRFVDELGKTFKKVVLEETTAVIDRNTISPDEHTFVIQGTDKLFLVYQPYFHRANNRFQLILSADIEDPANWKGYLNDRKRYPTEVFIVKTHRTTLQKLISARSFTASLRGQKKGKSEDINYPLVHFSNVQWRDLDYPKARMPFYLYGTQNETHVDHLLLLAPNIQFSADQVQLDVEPPLTHEQKKTGVIAFINRHEKSMQPFHEKKNSPDFFATGKEFKVEIYADPNPAEAHGPGLADIQVGLPLARGRLVLGPCVYADYDEVNRKEFVHYSLHKDSYTSRTTDLETREAWKTKVMADIRQNRPEEDFGNYLRTRKV